MLRHFIYLVIMVSCGFCSGCEFIKLTRAKAANSVKAEQIQLVPETFRDYYWSDVLETTTEHGEESTFRLHSFRLAVGGAILHQGTEGRPIHYYRIGSGIPYSAAPVTADDWNRARPFHELGSWMKPELLSGTHVRERGICQDLSALAPKGGPDLGPYGPKGASLSRYVVSPDGSLIALYFIRQDYISHGVIDFQDRPGAYFYKVLDCDANAILFEAEGTWQNELAYKLPYKIFWLGHAVFLPLDRRAESFYLVDCRRKP